MAAKLWSVKIVALDDPTNVVFSDNDVNLPDNEVTSLPVKAMVSVFQKCPSFVKCVFEKKSICFENRKQTKVSQSQ